MFSSSVAYEPWLSCEAWWGRAACSQPCVGPGRRGTEPWWRPCSTWAMCSIRTIPGAEMANGGLAPLSLGDSRVPMLRGHGFVFLGRAVLCPRSPRVGEQRPLPSLLCQHQRGVEAVHVLCVCFHVGWCLRLTLAKEEGNLWPPSGDAGTGFGHSCSLLAADVELARFALPKGCVGNAGRLQPTLQNHPAGSITVTEPWQWRLSTPYGLRRFLGREADFSGMDPALSAVPGDAGAGAAAACPGCRIGLAASMATGVAMAPRSLAGAAARRHGSTALWRHRACAAWRGDSPLGRSRAVAVATGNPA